MLRLEWNALRSGDRVVVHDDHDDLTLPPRPGTVTQVWGASRDHDVGITLDGDVGIALDGPGTGHVVRPRRLAVHLAPIDGTEDCWRCALVPIGWATRSR